MSINWLTIRVWLLVNILAASVAGTPAFAQGTVVVRVDPSALSVPVNSAANISIKVDNISNLIAFELHLSFNPNVLEVTSLSNGGFVAADITVQNVFDNAAGTIDYAIAQMNRPPAQGSGTLLNITFRAKANGSSTVTTRPTPAAPSGLLLSDQNGTAIQASWSPGTINVAPTITETFTPTPTKSPTFTPTPTGSGTSTPTPTGSSTATPTPTGSGTPTPTPTGSGTPTPTPTGSATPTPTRTNTPTITPPPPGTLGTHVVRWGEWLFCIGRAYKVSPWAIAKTNGIWWPNIIFPNQRLIIPNVPWTNIPAGPVCKAQFTISAPTPAPTAIPITPNVTVSVPTATPTPTATIGAATQPSTCRATYVVQAGDNLYRIALRYGTTYTELARVNGLSNPRLIYPGQQLCIP